MARNGSGQYNPPNNTWNPPVTGVLATGTDFKAVLDDISAALTQSVSADGQTVMTGNLPMNNNSITGIAAGTAAAPSISANGDSNTGVYFPAADTVGIATGGTQQVVVNSAGNVGVGATPSAFGVAYKALQIGGNPVITGANAPDICGNAYHNGTNWTYIGTAYSARYAVNFNNGGGHAWFTAPSGTAGNPITFTQAMTLDASGNLLVGVTSGTCHTLAKSNPASISTQIYNTSTNTSSSAMEVNVGYTGNTTGWFIRGGDSTQYRFYIYSNGNMVNSNNSYGAISDAKLKENVVDATPKLFDLNKVRVVSYNIIGQEQKQLGVIAQELEKIFPSMVDESPDYNAEGENLGTTTKSIKYSVFVPILIKAIQEQQAIIKTLSDRIAALEAK